MEAALTIELMESHTVRMEQPARTAARQASEIVIAVIFGVSLFRKMQEVGQ